MAWFVYMLRCGDGSLYTGSTNDLHRRLAAHQSGKGAKFTRSHLPVELVYREELPDKSGALRREAAVKKLTRQEKLTLIKEKENIAMVEMRRKDRRLTEDMAWAIVDKCEYAVLAMTLEDGTPYAIPITVAREGSAVYFHGAQAGLKVRLLEKAPRVCLTCVGETEPEPAAYATFYESAIVYGQASAVTEAEEKLLGLRLLCQRHAAEHMEKFDGYAAAHLAQTAVWKIEADGITGKAKRKK